jgi:hypothetical protein
MRPTNLFFAPHRDVSPSTLMPYASIHPSHPDLRVAFGQATFDAEGQEARGRFFSRVMHWPGGDSGVTLGRGYDMGQRTRLQIISELRHAGMSVEDATFFGQAAGLRGEAAARFTRARMVESPILSLPAQRTLFEEITFTETIADIQRIFTKPDVQARYGSVSWEDLSEYAQGVVFDLRYRGDYTPTTRARIQPLLVAKDDEGLRAALGDTAYWSRLNVPLERIRLRAAMSPGEDRMREAG